MAPWKQGKWYWADFTVNGQRFRVPLRTTGEHEEKKAIAEGERGRLTIAGQRFARFAFTEAADRFLSERLAQLSPLSVCTEKERAGRLHLVADDLKPLPKRYLRRFARRGGTPFER
jgi:hypothetical protein